jgi:TolB protein
MRQWPIAVVVVWLACTGAAHAAFPGQNGRLAYGDGLDIRTSNPDGSGEVQLTNDPAYDWNPEWSPDGRRILFTSNRPDLGPQVYVMNADGTGRMRLTDPPARSYSAAWSPDGQRIVFVRDGDLWMMNADASNQVPLLSRVGDEGSPDWSPDGRRIAFTNGSLWTMRPNGTGLLQVPTEAPPDSPSAGNIMGPEWSPDGQRIVYAAWTQTFDEEDRFYLATVRADGTGTRFLGPAYFYAPAWSPDGTRIAVGDGGSISTMRPDGADVRILSVFAEDVDWQPLPVDTPAPYIRPESARRVRAPLVPAYQACVAPDREHGPPLAFGACDQLGQRSLLTISTGEEAAPSTGALHIVVAPGAAGGPDDTDVRLGVAVTNVMTRADGAEYAGELRVRLPVRVTDQESSTSATTLDFRVAWSVPCTATADPALASSCALDTTLDAVLPGAAAEGTSAVWALGKAAIDDGGPDGDADTAAGNAPFLRQGLFVP